VPPFRLPPDRVTQRLHILDSTALVATLLAENGAWASEGLTQPL
jgi:ribose-phosphate pyrophosphokinase